LSKRHEKQDKDAPHCKKSILEVFGGRCGAHTSSNLLPAEEGGERESLCKKPRQIQPKANLNQGGKKGNWTGEFITFLSKIDLF